MRDSPDATLVDSRKGGIERVRHTSAFRPINCVFGKSDAWWRGLDQFCVPHQAGGPTPSRSATQTTFGSCFCPWLASLVTAANADLDRAIRTRILCSGANHAVEWPHPAALGSKAASGWQSRVSHRGAQYQRERPGAANPVRCEGDP
jgi:hypothetical protein